MASQRISQHFEEMVQQVAKEHNITVPPAAPPLTTTTTTTASPSSPPSGVGQTSSLALPAPASVVVDEEIDVRHSPRLPLPPPMRVAFFSTPLFNPTVDGEEEEEEVAPQPEEPPPRREQRHFRNDNPSPFAPAPPPGSLQLNEMIDRVYEDQQQQQQQSEENAQRRRRRRGALLPEIDEFVHLKSPYFEMGFKKTNTILLALLGIILSLFVKIV